MKRTFTLLTAMLVMALAGMAQIFTTSPKILQESSSNVVLTYHADSPLGNGDIKGLTASTPLYAHIGVITNKSNNSWSHVVCEWGVNTTKNQFNYVSANTWSLNIGNMRTYFGITDPTEHITRICVLPRTADGSKVGRTTAGGDIFVDVEEEGYQMQFTTSGSKLLSAATNLTFNVATTKASNITVAVNGTTIKTATGVSELDVTHNFATTGSYTVTATCTADGVTLTKSIDIAYPGKSQAGTYPGGTPKMGTVRNADGTVTFCIAAPGKNSVVMVPAWDEYRVLDKNIMKFQDYNGQRYFFTTVSGLKDNVDYPYYYIVDAKYKVGDPYARLVLDNYSDKWLDEDIWPAMPKYPYDKFDDVMLAVYNSKYYQNRSFSAFNIPDHDNLVIYELCVRDFTGTEGKANAEGTLRGVIEKLDYLNGLGINAIELMPVMEFNGNNSWGYNTNFYFALDKAYGSPDDLRELVAKAHSKGIAIILDIVFNQSDGLHPWYQMYDISANPFYNASAPHAYSVLNDWKQENALVQQQWKDVLQYWMQAYDIDGYRFDLVKGLGTSYGSNTDAYNSSRVAVMKNLHAAITAVKPNGIHINENLAGSQEENEMAADGQLNWANINNNSCQFAMGYASQSNLNRFLSTNDSRTAFSTVAYAESHDEERMGYKQIAYGSGATKTDKTVRMKRLAQVAAQMLATPGPKMIWQFGELGDEQTTKDSGGGNNTSPKIVNWNYLNDADRKGLHDAYAALGYLRRDNPELFSRSATFVATGFADNISSARIMRLTNGSKEVMVFINPALSGNNKTCGSSSTKLNANNCQLIYATPGFNPTLNGTGTSVSVSVPANSFAVFATKDVTGVDDIVSDSDNTTATVYGGQGQIVIVGDYNNVTVTNLAGQQQGSLSVAPGLYIVNVDGNVTKVMVR